jgi:DNA mismatch repair protein MSH4
MSERPGVDVYHLSVDMSNENTMTMLYKLGQGVVEEQHYGLALARVAGLPAKVLEVAENVSQTLVARAEAKKSSSKDHAINKRRKLLRSVQEQLEQLRDSPMEDDVLLDWLRKLQQEFVIRMEQIEKTIADADSDDWEENDVSEVSEGSADTEGA